MFQKQTVSQKQSNSIVLSNPKQVSSTSVSASNQRTTPATVEKRKSEVGLFVKLTAMIRPKI